MIVKANLALELPSVSSRSSDPVSSWMISPSHAFTIPLALLPNANSSGITCGIGTSALIEGEHVPLCPGVTMSEPPPETVPSRNSNGLGDTRLNVGEVGWLGPPPFRILIPANHSETGTLWWPGL